MSREYDLYLQRHKANVKRGYDWLRTNMPWLFEGQPDSAWQTEFEHDASKSNPDEYEAYDAYFYGGNRSYAVVQAFQYAWLLHIHRNPHHWQHWVLINDDPDEGEVLLEMPYNYIIEMICDWWAFSWEKGNLSEIFSWYDDHQAYIKLHPKNPGNSGRYSLESPGPAWIQRPGSPWRQGPKVGRPQRAALSA